MCLVQACVVLQHAAASTDTRHDNSGRNARAAVVPGNFCSPEASKTNMGSPSAPPTGPFAPGTRPDRRPMSNAPIGPAGPAGPAHDGFDPAAPLPQTLWGLRVPLCISHASKPTTSPFIVLVPRFSYLALLLPRLTAYFGASCSSFHHEEIQLRNLAVGLLLDLYQPAALPWQLVVSDGPEWDIADTFTNSAKEADFVRNGNAKQIMSLSKEHSTALWNAVQDSTSWEPFLLPLLALVGFQGYGGKACQAG